MLAAKHGKKLNKQTQVLPDGGLGGLSVSCRVLSYPL